MPTLQTISESLKLIDSKKQSLKTAFEDLQSHSSSFSSFNLTWSDIDSYFTSLQSSLQQKFKLLQSLEPDQSRSQQKLSNLSVSLAVSEEEDSNNAFVPVPARPELKSFCERMDVLGLVKYIANRVPREVAQLTVELADAWKYAPDAPRMVLDAMETRSRKEDEELSTKRVCALMALGLKESGVEIGAEARERAKRLTADWKKKLNSGKKKIRKVLWFLQFLYAFDLGDEFNADEIVDCFVCVADIWQAVALCRALVSADNHPHLIQKLINKGKIVQAVRFSCEFGLTEKFQPVPLLKAYVDGAKRRAKLCTYMGTDSQKSQKDVICREIGYLKSVIKCIERNNLESEYPMADLLKRIEMLKKKKSEKKHSIAETAAKQKPQLKKYKQSAKDNPRTTASLAGPAATQTSAAADLAVPLVHLPHMQTPGLLPAYHASQLDTSVAAYGLPGSTPAVSPYPGMSCTQYGLPGAPRSYPVNLTTNESGFYPPASHMPPAYYDGSNAYSGYGLPSQYHASYYPQ